MNALFEIRLSDVCEKKSCIQHLNILKAVLYYPLILLRLFDYRKVLYRFYTTKRLSVDVTHDHKFYFEFQRLGLILW